jgi:two-component system, cell cycle sensor histidine kinase DivJ
VGLYASVRNRLDALIGPLVHPLAQHDANAAVRHRAVLVHWLLGGLSALAAVIYLALLGLPGPFQILALVWLVVPVLAGYALSRTGFGLRDPHEDRYGVLARNMPDVITRHDRNGWVLFVSPVAETVFGAKLHDLYGRGLFDRMLIADRPAYLSALWDAATLHESRSVEFRARRDAVEPGSPGDLVWIEMRCRPIERTAGEDVAADREVVAVMRDVTDRKEQERALKDAHAEAERTNLDKSRFLATMSHELRTPLNAIIGFSEMLQDESGLRIDAERRQDYARLINESGRHLLAVVNGILDMSKIEAGNFEIMPERLAPGRVIGECCDLLALRAREAGIDVVVDLPHDLPQLVADKRALHQIMLNLLANALKFSNRGGNVTITARAGSDCMTVTVEDTGVGIGAEDLPRVGDPFFQARSSYDRRHDGTGLGVSIVKGLLALHGGSMQIESRIGEGTRVTVHLPLDCESARRNGETSAQVQFTPRADSTRSDMPVKKSA